MISETRKALEVENATLRARLSEAEEALRDVEVLAAGIVNDDSPTRTKEIRAEAAYDAAEEEGEPTVHDCTCSWDDSGRIRPYGLRIPDEDCPFHDDAVSPPVEEGERGEATDLLYDVRGALSELWAAAFFQRVPDEDLATRAHVLADALDPLLNCPCDDCEQYRAPTTPDPPSPRTTNALLTEAESVDGPPVEEGERGEPIWNEPREDGEPVWNRAGLLRELAGRGPVTLHGSQKWYVLSHLRSPDAQEGNKDDNFGGISAQPVSDLRERIEVAVGERGIVRLTVAEAVWLRDRLRAPQGEGEPTPEDLRDLADWFDNPTVSAPVTCPGFMGEATPGAMLRQIATEMERSTPQGEPDG